MGFILYRLEKIKRPIGYEVSVQKTAEGLVLFLNLVPHRSIPLNDVSGALEFYFDRVGNETGLERDESLVDVRPPFIKARVEYNVNGIPVDVDQVRKIAEDPDVLDVILRAMAYRSGDIGRGVDWKSLYSIEPL